MDCFFAKIIVPGNGCVSDQCILYFEYFASYFQKTNKKSVKKKFNKKFTIFFFFFFFEVAKKSQENWSEKMELEKYFDVAQKLIDQAGQVIREAIEQEKNVVEKNSIFDLVTETDKAVEDLLIKGLK